ncbi:Flp pilus assembly protein TadB [Microlunatus soli]|uniref:Flp pilus assembly protein TadB n=2 Tax=Microlunatus soli TaxID=630515 RepID=A0A1H1SXR2_9ACTN|nr:Flp pilus assembly protein TadB [Microlunatus soli]
MHVMVALALSVTLAGLSAAGLVSSPSGRLHRLGRQRRRSPEQSRLRWWLQLLAPRPYAPPVRTRYLVGVAAGLVAMLGWRVLDPDVGPVVVLAVPIIGVVMIIFLGRAELPAERRRREQMIQDLPHVLELMASAMNAGLPLRAAVREVVAVTSGPLTDDLADVVRNIDLGRSDADAWRALRDHPQLGRVSVDLARSVDSGTMLVAVLRRSAEIARRDRRGAMEARARTVGVKSVPPLMVCFVPAFLLVCVVPTIVSALQNSLG